MAVETDGRRGLGGLLRELAEGTATLARSEVRLARLELEELLRAVGRGTVLIATGATLMLTGGLALLVGIILLIGDQWLPNDLYWVAALIVFVLSGGFALVFATRGRSLLMTKRLAPEETVATLKEDEEWLKRQLTSGATSS